MNADKLDERSHKSCSFSTGIDGSITAGTGDLDANGYWSKPCEPCAKRANKLDPRRRGKAMSERLEGRIKAFARVGSPEVELAAERKRRERAEAALREARWLGENWPAFWIVMPGWAQAEKYHAALAALAALAAREAKP
jgi:hypothetical protein